ncbi:protein Z, vitamin K-dependent plasma glycoprotein b [Brachyhypopomus gauderio]|uniref:protein Z, vitamin K-dependent plasma glycoprotein b n=1 Tax=Brachyhypopomus gauderio TaxID=698409 RepID=UPI004041389E
MMEYYIWTFLLFALHCNNLMTNADQTVFTSYPQAHTIFQRHKRANAFFWEEIFKGNLEKECYEERCNKEEVREVFEDNQKTEDFWAIYYDGDQCKSNPCQNGGTCKDTIGGYSCTCTKMFTGGDCDKDVSECPSEGPLACEHFCKPMQGTFRCFCARGYSLQQDGRSCSPQVQNPCGNLGISSDTSAGLNLNPNDLNDKVCPQGHCPWQVTFEDGDGQVVCHGVILGKRSVLTTAGCKTTDKDLQMVFGQSNEKRNVSEATLHRTLHNRYMTGHPDDDLAFLVLKEPIILGLDTTPLCLPEKDFSENILMKTGREGVVVGGDSHASYVPLDDCHAKLNLTFSLTNKMFCMEEQKPKGIMRKRLQYRKCDHKSGTPVATVEGNTAFLTGLFLSESDCNQGLVFTKVSRYLPWIRQLLVRSEVEQR